LPSQFVQRPSVCGLFSLNDFFSRTTWPISTKLDEKHDWGMGIQICLNKGAGPFWGPNKGKIRKIWLNLLLMNLWPECIDIWHGTSLGQGDSNLFK